MKLTFISKDGDTIEIDDVIIIEYLDDQMLVLSFAIEDYKLAKKILNPTHYNCCEQSLTITIECNKSVCGQHWNGYLINNGLYQFFEVSND